MNETIATIALSQWWRMLKEDSTIHYHIPNENRITIRHAFSHYSTLSPTLPPLYSVLILTHFTVQHNSPPIRRFHSPKQETLFLSQFQSLDCLKATYFTMLSRVSKYMHPVSHLIAVPEIRLYAQCTGIYHQIRFSCNSKPDSFF